MLLPARRLAFLLLSSSLLIVPAGPTQPAARYAPGQGGAGAAAPVVYRISQLDAASHTARVECHPPLPGETTFALPRWVPGYYYRLPLRQYVSDVRLTGRAGRELPLREDPSHWSWQATIPAGEPVTFSYTLHAAEGEGNRGLAQLYVGPQTAFLMPGGCLVYLAGHEGRPCELEMSLPAGWTAVAPLPQEHGRFRARNFDELDDSPVEMGLPAPGALTVVSTQAAKHPLRVVISGAPEANPRAVEEVARKAIEAHAALFGEVPFPDYTLEMHAGTGAGGGIIGLEHSRAATLAFWSRFPLSEANLRGRGATLVFHETFHAWNVKAMRPAELSPYHLDQIPHCPTLWFAEGFTDYYGDLEPFRSGLWPSPDFFYDELASAWRSYADSSGRRRTPLMRASAITFDDRRYGEGDGTSYYVKGMLVACLLDLDIRSRTRGAKSLDDVMRWVYRQYPASRGGYPDNFLPGAILAATGLDLSRECHSYLETADDLPLANRLALAGLTLTEEQDDWRVQEDASASPAALRLRRAWLSGRGEAYRSRAEVFTTETRRHGEDWENGREGEPRLKGSNHLLSFTRSPSHYLPLLLRVSVSPW